jgi:hypothetical protein
VDEKADTVSEVLDEIIPHVLRNEWDVVAHLSLQIKTHRSLRRQNQAIDQLIALLSRSRPVDEQRALASFAARSLQYLVASESQVKLLVELIFSEATSIAEDEQFLLALRHCAFCSAERREFVRKLLLDLIAKTFRKGEQPSIGNLFKALSTSTVFSARGDTVSPSWLPSDLQENAREAVRRMVVDRATTDKFFATVAWCWYGLINEALLRKHGVDTYFNANVELNHYGVDGLTSLVLTGSNRFARMDTISQESSVSALSVIGRVGFTGPPLDRAKFKAPYIGSTAPLTIWRHLFKQYRKDPEALAGAFFIFLVVTGLAELPPQPDPGEASVESVKTDILGSKSLKKLDYYPQILRAATASVLVNAAAA